MIDKGKAIGNDAKNIGKTLMKSVNDIKDTFTTNPHKTKGDHYGQK